MHQAPTEVFICAEIWEVEVAHQIKAKNAGTTNGNVGITREITINLEREQQTQ